jgi:hypothetical protein
VEGVLADLSMPIAAITLVGISAMACAFHLTPPASLRSDRGRSTAGPSH